MTREYLPELDYYFNKYWEDRGEITVYDVPKPEVENIDNLSTDSIFAMMFNVAYSHYYYNYRFVEQELSIFSRPIKDRLRSSGTTTKYYLSDSTAGTNILLLTEENISLLNKLLTYRSTNTVDLTDIEYTDLEGRLSKLIYQYLNFMTQDEYQTLNVSDLISESGNLLENLFELFVINEAHKKMKNSSIIVSGSTIILRPQRDLQEIDEDIVLSKQWETLETPYSTAEFYVFLNGNLLTDSQYNLIDTTNLTVLIDWNSTGLSVVEDDVMIADYYTEV